MKQKHHNIFHPHSNPLASSEIHSHSLHPLLSSLPHDLSPGHPGSTQQPRTQFLKVEAGSCSPAETFSGWIPTAFLIKPQKARWGPFLPLQSIPAPPSLSPLPPPPASPTSTLNLFSPSLPPLVAYTRRPLTEASSPGSFTGLNSHPLSLAANVTSLVRPPSPPPLCFCHCSWLIFPMVLRPLGMAYLLIACLPVRAWA